MFQFVIDDLINRGIRISNCPYYENCDAPLSSVILNESTSSRTIVHSNPNLPILTFENFKEINLSDYRWIHFEARNPTETENMLKMIQKWNDKFQNNRITISLELEKQREGHLILIPYVDVVFLGKDFALYSGVKNMKEAVYFIRGQTTNKCIIICPWGTEGAGALDCTDEYVSCKAHSPKKVVDTLGAGDTFISSAIFGLSKNWSLERTISFASKVAGEKVGHYGYDDIKDFYQCFI